MALTQIEYSIVPNFKDNKMRSWDPTGVYDPDPGGTPEPLVSQTALGVTNITQASATLSWQLSETTHTGQEAQFWVTGFSESWTDVSPSILGKNERTLALPLSEIPAGVLIRARMRTSRTD